MTFFTYLHKHVIEQLHNLNRLYVCQLKHKKQTYAHLSHGTKQYAQIEIARVYKTNITIAKEQSNAKKTQESIYERGRW